MVSLDGSDNSNSPRQIATDVQYTGLTLYKKQQRQKKKKSIRASYSFPAGLFAELGATTLFIFLLCYLFSLITEHHPHWNTPVFAKAMLRNKKNMLSTQQIRKTHTYVFCTVP